MAPAGDLPPATKYFWGDTPEPDEYYASQGVRHAESYFQSPHGRLFTHSFHPLSAARDGDVKGVVFMTHGYGSDTSWLFQSIAISYACWGYAVFCADLLGHGRSDGVHGYLGDMEAAAAASLAFFLSVRTSEPYAPLPAFLFGESMGGAATLLMYLRSPSRDAAWTGLIFSAPLFVIPDDMYPSRIRLFLYGLLFGLADTWAVLPDKKMVGKSIRDPDRLRVIASNPRRYGGAPRVGTMRELARVTQLLQASFGEVTAPVPGRARHRGRRHRAGGVQDAVRARGQRGQGAHPLRGDVPLAHPGRVRREPRPRALGHARVDRRARPPLRSRRCERGRQGGAGGGLTDRCSRRSHPLASSSISVSCSVNHFPWRKSMSFGVRFGLQWNW